MNQNDCTELYRQYFDMEKDSLLFEDTLRILQRVTRARDVAEVVSRLFDVDRISSDIVITKKFINVLIGIAVSLEKGRSVNNIREHINNMLVRDRWKIRERENRQRPSYKLGPDTVTFNLTITMKRDLFLALQEIIVQFAMTLKDIIIDRSDK